MENEVRKVRRCYPKSRPTNKSMQVIIPRGYCYTLGIDSDFTTQWEPQGGMKFMVTFIPPNKEPKEE